MVKKQNYEKTLNGLNNLDVATSMTIDETLEVNGASTFNDNVVIQGTLEVDGATFQAEFLISTQTLLKLGSSNTGAAKDIGFYGKYVESATTKFAGLFLDADNSNNELDQYFTLFKGLTTEPSNEVVGAVSTASLYLNTLRASGNIILENSGNKATIQSGSLGGDITLTFPNATGTLALTTATTALEAWRTDFNNITNGKILIKTADNDFGEITDNSSTWNYNTSWRVDFNNITNGKILKKTANNDFGELTDNSTNWNDNTSWRTTFNNLTNGHICKISSDNNFTSVADNSSNWNLTDLWRDTFNSNVSTNELLYKSDTDTIDGLAWNNSTTSASDNSIVRRSSGKITAYQLDFGNWYPVSKITLFGGSGGTNTYSFGIYAGSLNYTVPSNSSGHRFYDYGNGANNGNEIVRIGAYNMGSASAGYLNVYKGGLVLGRDGTNYGVGSTNGAIFIYGGASSTKYYCNITATTLSTNRSLAIPNQTGTLAITSDIAYTTGFDVRIDAESSGYTVPSGGTVKLLGGTNISLSRSNGEITINETATASTTALEAWRTDFNYLTDGYIVVKAGDNDFGQTINNSSDWNANTTWRNDFNALSNSKILIKNANNDFGELTDNSTNWNANTTWRTDFNALTNGQLCIKNANNDFSSIAYSSTAGQANKILQVDSNGYIQTNRITAGSNYISLSGSDIVYFVPASTTNGITTYYKHTWGVGSGDIRMTMDSLTGIAMYKTFVVRDTYVGSYNMIYADATNGVQLNTAGGTILNADADGEVNIYGGSTDKDEPITLWGSNVVVKAITAAGGLGTITMTDASNVALTNITCGTIGAGTNAITCGQVLSRAGTTTNNLWSHFGCAKIGNYYNDYAGFWHEDITANVQDYAIIQENTGTTYVNAKSGTGVYLRINNTNRISIVDTSGGEKTTLNVKTSAVPTFASANTNPTANCNVIENPCWVAKPNYPTPNIMFEQTALNNTGSGRAPLSQHFVTHYYNYSSVPGFTTAPGSSFYVGMYEGRTIYNISMSFYTSAGGFKNLHLYAWCIGPDSGSNTYTWRKITSWRVYVNQTYEHFPINLYHEETSVLYPFQAYYKFQDDSSNNLLTDTGDVFMIKISNFPKYY